MTALSIVIPTLNEAEEIVAMLTRIQSWRQRSVEVIVVDGGSHDGTPQRVVPWVDIVVTSARGRALQMNTGARHAQGELLLFLHADTWLPEDPNGNILALLTTSHHLWGWFRVDITGHHPLLRIVALLMNLRSCLTSIATGDQAIFVSRDQFWQLGGFPEIPIMEDIAFCRLAKASLSSPLCIRTPVVTSGRRWQRHGIWTTIGLMWGMRLAYWLGVAPERLVRWYGDLRRGV
ncbi:MAG: TIGR04283 family arsenosugar biosynthesis glycosyltransferase [Magnetococcales bacterium]|nr:TIGR04283 family arsenosugar biosynthesis glycosyltransferase [Magnetococcales bacterium]